jgi:prevent-host-death family protein
MMRDREPVVQTIKASEVRQQFSRVINEVFRKETRVIVEKSGIPVAAIISARELARFERLEEERRQRFAALESTRQAFDNVPDEEIEEETAKAVAQVRGEKRQTRRTA